MSIVKGKLKYARETLAKKDYIRARDVAIEVLDYEPENYNANVFLGLALLELDQFEESEQVNQAYNKAIHSNPEQLLAWQGISKFYERTNAWGKYADTLQRLVDLFSRSNDVVKCAETLQKLVELRRRRGTRNQVVEALSSFLPQSPIYFVLSRLPAPDPTRPSLTTTYATQVAIHDSLPVFKEIIALLEEDEDESIKKEVDKRRMRLCASGPEQLKKEVGSEIWGRSRLPALYNEILNHPNTSDDLRRATDSKLLRYQQQYLHSLSESSEFSSAKAKVASDLEGLVNGAVMLRIPDELAWTIWIEGRDCETIEGYDCGTLRHFLKLFPSSPMSSLLKGYFSYMGIAPSAEDSENSEEQERSNDVALDMILDAQSAIPHSILANRILAELCLRETDYQSAIGAAERALELVSIAERDNGRNLPQVRMGLMTVLAISLVHLFPPKHHPRALLIIDDILSQSPDNVGCLMGRGYILLEAQKWSDAAALFARVTKLIPHDMERGLRAKEEHAWCQCREHGVERGVLALQGVLDALNELADKDLDCARCLWRIGKCYWDMGADRRDEAYGYFIQSLKRYPNYGPAFTSLGIYYSEFVCPSDPIRASKCFQKAFELDAREAYAARRLAEGFAQEREWDLVEVVARRTIEAEGGLTAGLKGGDEGKDIGRYHPTNAWAWKAVGVVELTHRNYSLAIQAFQIALRAEPQDQLSWLRLGEAYGKLGRYAAAVKALGRAHELHPDDWMCSYFIGEVRRQIGHFQEAIDSFQLALTNGPSDVGILLSLGQTYLALGRAELSDGFAARAEQSFVTSIRVALETIKGSPGFRNVAWKTVADAAFFLSNRSSFINDGLVFPVLSEVASLLYVESGDCLSDITSLLSLQGYSSLNGIQSLEISVAAYEYRISLSSSDNVGSGSAWFDLGIALYSWTTRVSTSENQQRAERKAITCLKAALREDPGNDAYWNALGNTNFSCRAKVAQHAFINALDIDPKNVITWTNLGLLYFHHNDLELADEALYRARTLDPDYALAWVGQALVAIANGHDVEATAILEHAVGLAATVPEADLEFGAHIFTELNNSGKSDAHSFDELLPTFFVLERYCKRHPEDASALHLFGLVCERLGRVESAVDLISQAIVILEAAYEDTEDPEVEQQFTIANSNMGRLRLSLQDYQGAMASYESALGLLSEDDYDPTIRALRTQLQLGSGLVTFKLGDLEAALSLFEAALETAGDNLVARAQVNVLLAQTLWAMGTEEFRELAKARLLECITTNPDNLTAINALAGMGTLTEDDNLVDAAISEIQGLPLEQRFRLDPQGNINYLLVQHHLGQGDLTKALSLSQWALFVEPARPEIRNKVATLTLQYGKYSSALAILSLSTSVENGRNLDSLDASLSLRAVAESLNDSLDAKTIVRQAQRAVMMSPWHLHHWQSLAFVLSKVLH